MKRMLKRSALGLVAALVLGSVLVYGLSEREAGIDYSGVVGHPLILPAEASEIAEGGRLLEIFHCTDCHGDDLGGGTMVDAPLVGRLAASNLTTGEGGIGGSYDPTDWERAIRHGVRPDGRALLVMPSEDFGELSNQDLGRMVAFLRSLPPVDRALPSRRLGPMMRGFLVAGGFDFAPAFEQHTGPVVAAQPKAATANFGRYLSTTCKGCHSADLGGGEAVEPGGPPAANLTPHPVDGLGAWSLEDFERALRTGVRPDGRQLDPVMPSASFAHFDDLEVEAIWAYLRSVPALSDDEDS
jgi:mono/diheme cytochrome c family protein